jgi:ABC-type multidrug transport system ATPase subunit
MRTISTLQNPIQAEFDGINVLEDQMGLRKILGYLPQEFGVYPNMSAEKLWIILPAKRSQSI